MNAEQKRRIARDIKALEAEIQRLKSSHGWVNGYVIKAHEEKIKHLKKMLA